MPVSGGVNSQGSWCQVHSESGVLPKIFISRSHVLSCQPGHALQSILLITGPFLQLLCASFISPMYTVLQSLQTRSINGQEFLPIQHIVM